MRYMMHFIGIKSLPYYTGNLIADYLLFFQPLDLLFYYLFFKLKFLFLLGISFYLFYYVLVSL